MLKGDSRSAIALAGIFLILGAAAYFFISNDGESDEIFEAETRGETLANV